LWLSTTSRIWITTARRTTEVTSCFYPLCARTAMCCKSSLTTTAHSSHIISLTMISHDNITKPLIKRDGRLYRDGSSTHRHKRASPSAGGQHSRACTYAHEQHSIVVLGKDRRVARWQRALLGIKGQAYNLDTSTRLHL